VVPVERLGITQEHARKIQLFLLNQRLARSIYSQIVLTMKMIVEVNVFVMPRHFDRFGGLTGSVVEYVSAFTKKNGLPCKHTLYAQLEEAHSQSRVFAISVLEVHQHWWFRPPRASNREVQEERYILDPAKVKPKGRPVGSTRVTLPKKTPTKASQAIRGRNPHRSRRDKSGWEHVQAAYNASATSQDTSTTTQDDQQAPEVDTEVFRRSQRTRVPTQKVIDMQDEVDEGPIELSSGSEHDSEDDSEASDGVEEVEEFTVVRRKVTRKVPKVTLMPKVKPKTKAQRDNLMMAAITNLQAQMSSLIASRDALGGPQNIDGGFTDIENYPMDVDEVDLTADTALKATKKAPTRTPGLSTTLKTTRIKTGIKRKAPSLKIVTQLAAKKGRKA
jgi:hypothetical protein